MITIEPGQIFYTAVEVVPDAYEDVYGADIEGTFPVTDGDKQVLFATEEAARTWLSENGLITLESHYAKHQEQLDADYAKDLAAYRRAMKRHQKKLDQYQADLLTVQDLIAKGTPKHLVSRPVKPAEPKKPAGPRTATRSTYLRYHRVVPVTFIA